MIDREGDSMENKISRLVDQISCLNHTTRQSNIPQAVSSEAVNGIGGCTILPLAIVS